MARKESGEKMTHTSKSIALNQLSRATLSLFLCDLDKAGAVTPEIGARYMGTYSYRKIIMPLMLENEKEIRDYVRFHRQEFGL